MTINVMFANLASKTCAIHDVSEFIQGDISRESLVILHNDNWADVDVEGLIGGLDGLRSKVVGNLMAIIPEEKKDYIPQLIKLGYSVIVDDVSYLTDFGNRETFITVDNALRQAQDNGISCTIGQPEFHFAEDDPKQYFKHFLEFAAYGGDNEAVNKYWEELKRKFGLEGSGDNIKAIREKFGLDAVEYKDLILEDKTINTGLARQYLEKEYNITEQNTIYKPKITCTGKLVEDKTNGYYLCIKSNGLEEEFKEGNGVKTVFHFSKDEFAALEKNANDINISNIGQVAAINPRLAAAIGETIHQMNNIHKGNQYKKQEDKKKHDDCPVFANYNLERGGIGMGDRRPSVSPKPVEAKIRVGEGTLSI
ncbi:hypothetical protein N8772_00095 [Rickettsiales bacterium]|nr:hypothetical protein [Rickettsiales bacterium]